MDKLTDSSPDYESPQGADFVVANPAALPDWNYEATVTKIEHIIAQIESGELDLADVFDQFATAVEYLNQCETFLTQRQQQMDILIETLMDQPS